jgi:two-component system, NtrC family, sensor kinase
LEQTREGAKRVAEIVLAMSNFAHSGNSVLQPVVLDEIIRATVEITSNSWKDIAQLSMEFATPPLVVRGVNSDLGQVFLNLIMNAADAIADSTPAGGDQALGKIRIQTRRKDNWAEIVIEDTGCGIELSLLKKIFEPFFTTKDVGRGSGQGLAIAYGILTEEHGGDLCVESKPGEGSTFIVRLPLDDSQSM